MSDHDSKTVNAEEKSTEGKKAHPTFAAHSA